MKVTGPYRAEHRRKKATGAWRENVEQAFADARLLGSGAEVFSSERVLLAKFENAVKFVGPAARAPGMPRTHKALNGDGSPEEEDETDETDDPDE